MDVLHLKEQSQQDMPFTHGIDKGGMDFHVSRHDVKRTKRNPMPKMYMIS